MTLNSFILTRTQILERTVRLALAMRAPAWAKISMARMAHVATSMEIVSVPEYGATAAT